MERLLPAEAAEPIVRGGTGAVLARGTLFALLGLVVAAGGWLRFNTQIAGVVPGLGLPGLAAADQARPRALLELGLVPDGEAQGAVAEMGLPAGDAALLRAALRERRVRLVRMPLVDETPDMGGHDVRVSTAGYTRVVRLTRTPVAVALPVAAAGEVSFATPDADAVGIGAMGLSGPVRLPDITRGDLVSVGVVAQ